MPSQSFVEEHFLQSSSVTFSPACTTVGQKSLVTVRDTSTAFPMNSFKVLTVLDSSAVVSDSSLAELPSESVVGSQRY